MKGAFSLNKLFRVVADVWEKDVWHFQAKSGSSGSFGARKGIPKNLSSQVFGELRVNFLVWFLAKTLRFACRRLELFRKFLGSLRMILCYRKTFSVHNSCRLFLHFLGKIAVQKCLGKRLEVPDIPSSSYPQPSDFWLVCASSDFLGCNLNWWSQKNGQKSLEIPKLLVKHGQQKPPQNRGGFCWPFSASFFSTSVSFSPRFSLFPAVSWHLGTQNSPPNEATSIFTEKQGTEGQGTLNSISCTRWLQPPGMRMILSRPGPNLESASAYPAHGTPERAF